jgi:hypothetical protein
MDSAEDAHHFTFSALRLSASFLPCSFLRWMLCRCPPGTADRAGSQCLSTNAFQGFLSLIFGGPLDFPRKSAFSPRY